MSRVLPPMRGLPVMGEASYHLAGVGAYWTRRGAVRLGNILGRLRLAPRVRPTRITVRIRRVSELNIGTRIGMRLWLAWIHGWRTKWADFDWYVTMHSGGRLVSVAGVVDRLGAIDGVPTRLGLLGGVFTIPEFRKRGMASELIRRSTTLMTDELGSEFGVLMCGDRLVPFYERLGWKHVPNVAKFERFGRPGFVETNVMVYQCTDRPLPEGAIDMRGLPA